MIWITDTDGPRLFAARRNTWRNAMLSGEALDVAFALRAGVGSLVQGDGPAVEKLCEATGLPEAEFARALAELESVGFVGLDRNSAAEAAVIVLAPLQVYLDDLENQDTDAF